MALEFACPECATRLRVPTKKVGGMVTCPKCARGFLALPGAAVSGQDAAPLEPELAEADAAPAAGSSQGAGSAEVAATSGAAATQTAVGGRTAVFKGLAAPTTPAHGQAAQAAAIAAPVAKSSSPPTPSAPAPSPPPSPESQATAEQRRTRTVPRFRTGDAATSQLVLAPDGQLPELRLNHIDEEEEDNRKAEKSSNNPVLLAVVVMSSVLMTAVLLLLDSGITSNESAATRKAREKLIDFLGEGPNLQPYQVDLRTAIRAHSQRDYKTEREHYRRVLDRLRAERHRALDSVTESQERDQELFAVLSDLMK